MGLDVTFLLDSKAVKGAGHSGAIVGQPGGDKFTYRSYGPKHSKQAVGEGKVEKKTFKTYKDALSYAKKQGYDHFARYETDAVQDKAALQAAKAFKGTQYNGTCHNCQDMVNSMMQAAEVPFVGNALPNVSYKLNVWTASESGELR